MILLQMCLTYARRSTYWSDTSETRAVGYSIGHWSLGILQACYLYILQNMDMIQTGQ